MSKAYNPEIEIKRLQKQLESALLQVASLRRAMSAAIFLIDEDPSSDAHYREVCAWKEREGETKQ